MYLRINFIRVIAAVKAGSTSRRNSSPPRKTKKMEVPQNKNYCTAVPLWSDDRVTTPQALQFLAVVLSVLCKHGAGVLGRRWQGRCRCGRSGSEPAVFRRRESAVRQAGQPRRAWSGLRGRRRGRAFLPHRRQEASRGMHTTWANPLASNMVHNPVFSEYFGGTFGVRKLVEVCTSRTSGMF